MSEPVYDQSDADNYYLAVENRALRVQLATLTADLAQARQQLTVVNRNYAETLAALGADEYDIGPTLARQVREERAQARAALSDERDDHAFTKQQLAEALQARDAAHAQIADLQDILNQRQARLEAIEQALAEARKESEWRGEKLQSVAKFAARTALLEAARDARDSWGPHIEAWLLSRAGEPR